MKLGRIVRLGGLLVAGVALSAVVVFALGHSQAGTSQAAMHGAMAVDCDAGTSGVQIDCSYAPGSSFQIEVHVTAPPAGGYGAFQAKLEWTEGVTNYLPTEAASDEALWSNCSIAVRINNWELSGEPSVGFGCVTFPPLPVGDTFTGPVLTFEFQCKSAPDSGSPPAGLDPNQSVLNLVPNEPFPAPGGTFFTDVGLQPIDPALTGATITCEEGAPSPAATPTPDGDGDGDGDGEGEGGVSLTDGETVIEAGEDTELTFTVKDSDGNTVEGVDCAFSIVGPDGTDASLSSATGTTDANGDVSVTLTGGTKAETVQVEVDCGSFGSFVQDVTVSPTLPTTGAELAEGGLSVGLWTMIGALLIAAAAGLTVFGWRSTRAR